MFNSKKYIYVFILVILLLLTPSIELYARAGGAGDFDTGDDADGFIIGIILSILTIIPYPYNLWTAAAFVLIIIILWVADKLKK